MAIVAAVAVGLLAFVIAAYVIGREARRLGAQPLQPVYRLTEAMSLVAEGLTDEAASALDAEQLESIVRIHLNVLQFGASPEAAADIETSAEADEHDDDTSVVDADSAAQAVYRRAMRDGIDVTRPDVDAVIEAHLGYLAAIGALGPVEGGTKPLQQDERGENE